jgi:Ca-activated chloride channel family protein
MIDWEAFHFIRPEWLWAIPAALLLAFLLTKISAKRSGWQSVVSNHLYQRLVISNDKKAATPPFYLLALAMTIASVAIAGPTWKQLPQPVYQVETGKVILLDMSMSMRATDLQPDRLSRAKFKTIDLLNSFEDGEVGLVVYAGDAFTVSPLTSDTANITALVPSLRPEIMPLPGSEPIYALEEAERLLAAAGYAKGEIYWITDGIDFGLVEELRDFIAKSSYQYSVLGVGTRAGAPIQLEDGSLLKDARGNIVLPSLNSNLIKQALGTSGGRFTSIQSDDSDIQNMLFESTILDQNQVSNEVLGQGDQWQDMGVYLTFLILPFAAYAFRKGVLVLVLAVGLTIPAEQAYASQWYENIFKNNNQKGLSSFEKENYATASEQFEDPMWKGAALYKNGDYDAALAAFKQASGAESHYNQGNALAQMGQLLEALEQYETTLTLDPGHENAQTNKKIVEDLLKQQEDEKQQQQDQQNQDGQNSDDSEGGESQESGQSSESDNDAQSENDSDGQPSGESDQQSQSEDAQQSQDQENNEQRSDGSQQAQSEVPEEGEQQQNQAQSQTEQDQSPSSEAENAQQNNQETEQERTEEQQISAVQKVNEEDLTPEQREQAQRMQMLMNKVTDDPAFLLQRKMQLESQKRRRERISQPNKKDW